MPDLGRWGSNGGDPSLHDINRTDQFLDALASQQPVYAGDREEAELAQLLAGWRDDVRETPVGTLLSVDDAATALERVNSPGRRRRLSLAVVGSAAAAVLCLGGFGAVVAGSGPGDALYGLRTMMFGDQSPAVRDDAVILAAQTEMQQVQQLIEQGDWEGAKTKLEAVTTTVATVGDVESRQDLVTQWQELTVKVEAQDSAATVSPGAPLPTFPDLPAVVIDPNSLSVTVPSETTAPSETTSETTAPSETTSETTAPSDSPAPSTSPTPTSPTSPTSPSPTSTPTATSTSAAAPTSGTSPSSVPTSTVVEQSSSVQPSPSSSPRSTPSPTPTTTAASPAATPQPTPTPASTPAPTTTAVPTAAEEEAPSPTSQVITTTTTTVVPGGQAG